MTKPFNIFAAEESEQTDLADVLVSQGLVTHIAVIQPADAALSDIARFRQDAARKAATVITLSPGRFGIALSPSARLPLSDVPHTLTAADIDVIGQAASGGPDLVPLEPTLLAVEGRLATVERACAPEVLAQLMRDAASSAMAAVVEDLRVEPPRGAQAAEHDGGALVADVLSELKATLAELPKIVREAAASSIQEAQTGQSEGEERLVRHLSSEAQGLEERLTRAANELAEASSDRYGKLCTQLAEQDARRDDAYANLSTQLDGVLASQGTTPATTAAVAEAVRATLLPALEPRLGSIEARLSPGDSDTTAAGEAEREKLAEAIEAKIAVRLDAFEAQLARLDASRAAPSATADVISRLDEICGRVLDAVAKTDVQVAADLDRLKTMLETHAHEANARSDSSGGGVPTISATDVTAPIVAALDPKLTELNDAILAHLSNIATSLGAGAGATADPGQLAATLVAHLDPRLADLELRVVERLDVLEHAPASPNNDTADPATLLRSIRNFWLAIEEALTRQSQILERIEDYVGGDPAIVLPASNTEMLDRLCSVEAELQSLKSAVVIPKVPAATVDPILRRAVAELLARGDRAVSQAASNEKSR